MTNKEHEVMWALAYMDVGPRSAQAIAQALAKTKGIINYDKVKEFMEHYRKCMEKMPILMREMQGVYDVQERVQ